MVNLYPFAEAAARDGTTEDELIEQIDIGGPTLVRAAAKNHASVGIVTDPAQYDAVMLELGHGRGLTQEMRRELALAAFKLTADYDAMISTRARRALVFAAAAADAAQAAAAAGDAAPRPAPPPAAALRREPAPVGGPLWRARASTSRRARSATASRVVQGKPLSYNNILDASAAAALARDLRGAACAVIKHANPCGAAEAATWSRPGSWPWPATR